MRAKAVLTALMAIATYAIAAPQGPSTDAVVKGVSAGNSDFPGKVVASFYLTVSGAKVTKSPYFSGSDLQPFNQQIFVGSVGVELCHPGHCPNYKHAVMHLIKDGGSSYLALSTTVNQQIYIDPTGCLRYWNTALPYGFRDIAQDGFYITNSTSMSPSDAEKQVLAYSPDGTHGQSWKWYLCPFGVNNDPQIVYLSAPGFTNTQGCEEFEAVVNPAEGQVYEWD